MAFQDNRITKPRLTHADLLVKAVGDLSNRLKGMNNARNEANLNDLQRLIDTTTSFTERNKSQAAAEAPSLRVTNLEAAAQRVPATEPSVLRVPQTARHDGPASRTRARANVSASQHALNATTKDAARLRAHI